MFNYDSSTIRSSVMAAVAAFALTAISIGAAAGPVRTAESGPALAAVQSAQVSANG